MLFDKSDLLGVCTQLAGTCQDIRALQGKRAFSGRLAAYGHYSALPADKTDDPTYFQVNEFYDQDLSAHVQMKALSLHRQAEELLNDLGHILRNVPALDHDALIVQVRIGQRSRRGPRIKLNILHEHSRQSVIPVLCDEIDNLCKRIARLEGVPKPDGRTFVIDDAHTIAAASPEAAMRVYATFAKPALFKEDPSSYPSITEILDPVGPVRALLL